MHALALNQNSVTLDISISVTPIIYEILDILSDVHLIQLYLEEDLTAIAWPDSRLLLWLRKIRRRGRPQRKLTLAHELRTYEVLQDVAI